MTILRLTPILLGLMGCAEIAEEPVGGKPTGTDNFGPENSDDSVLTGDFLGMQGIAYRTESQGGVTDGLGQFAYRQGETVEFLVGDVVLGSAQGKAQMSVFDLAGMAEPPVGASAITKMARTPAFQHAINLAVFLASFDDNGDLSDGVALSPAVSDLFIGAQLRFDVPFQTIPFGATQVHGPSISPFRNGTFNKAFIAAQDIFSVPHSVVSAPRAMQVVYGMMGLDAQLVAATKHTSAESVSPDELTVVNTVYSAEGYPQDIEVSNTSGAEVTQPIDRYDENGNHLRWKGFSPTTATYDIHNNLHTQVDDTSSITAEHIYDENGYLVAIEMQTEQKSDGSLTEKVISFSYNQDNQIERIATGSDTSTFEYDQNHNITKMTMQGTSSSTWTFTYDGDNNQLTLKRVNSVGDVTRQETHEYDASSNVIAIDSTVDGTSYRTTFEYDNQGRLVLQQGEQYLGGNIAAASMKYAENTASYSISYASGKVVNHNLDLAPVGWGILGTALDTIEYGHF